MSDSTQQQQEQESSFLNKQAEPLFGAVLSGGIVNIFAACLIYLFLYNSPQESNALKLCAVITVFSVFRMYLSHHYHSKQLFKIETYVKAHVFFTFLIGVIWAIFEYEQVNFDDESLRSLVFLVNFGLIAGSIATLSAWLYSYLAYMIPQSLAILYVFANIESEYNLQMSATFSIFIVVMIITSVQFNRRLIKELELVDDLNNEIGIREEVQFELERSKQGLEKKVDLRTKELVDSNQHLESVILKKEEAEKSLQYLAYHDELTGLPNKNLLVDRISQSIKISARDNQQMAILFLDLDRFKTINDSLGHIIGDLLLQEVASRIHKTLREHDTVSRNGGDEFVVVLEKLKSYNEAIGVAKKVIESLTAPFNIHSHGIHIGASIGISVYPSDGDTPSILLRNADTAMYRAKQVGGNQLQFYDASMSNQLRDRLELESELHGALENNEFYMVYQPQVSAKTGVTTGVESLMRWTNPKHGEISPDRFVPLLEETGLIYSVGKWVITEVIKLIQSQGNNDITFSINLSALQCNNHELIDFVELELEKASVDSSKIEFEITESLLINDFDKTKLFLDRLHGLGCTIALDDFGTGYTSMNYISRLPIDVIKIDKSLIRNIEENNNLKSIVSAIVTMSSSLGMVNVFEGIETKSELLEIQKLHGDIIQGYYYSKPLNKVALEVWLSNGQAKLEA